MDKGMIKFVFSVTSFVLAVTFFLAPYLQQEPVSGTVVEKYVKRSGKSDKFYMVIEKSDGKTEIFQNTDMLFKGKFNSADIQATTKVGDKINFNAIGWRVNALSMYRGMSDIEERDVE